MIRDTRVGSRISVSFEPHMTTTVPAEASLTYATMGELGSPWEPAPPTFSVSLATFGAATAAPKAAAPTAAFLKKLLRDISPFFSSAMWFSSNAWGEPTSPPTPSPGDGTETYHISWCVTSNVTGCGPRPAVGRNCAVSGLDPIRDRPLGRATWSTGSNSGPHED